MNAPPPSVSLPWQFWRSFIDNIPAAVAVLDTGLCYVDISQRWLESFHMRRDDLIGRRIGSILTPVASAMHSLLQECLDGTIPKAEGEFQLSLDNQSHWFSWEAQCWWDEQQLAAGVIVYTKDITAQKHADIILRASERRFRTLFQYSPVAYMCLDSKGAFLDVNEELCRMLGGSPQNLIGQIFCDYVTGASPDCIAAMVQDDQMQTELELRHASGQHLTVLLVSRVQRNTMNRFVAAHCIVFDISHRKKVERELERLNQVKTDFMTNMSHELRTPLNAINGFSYMIKERSLGPDAHDKYRDYAGIIHEAGEHLLSLINDILDITSLESGHLTIWEESVDLTAITESCLSMMGNMAASARVSLKADVSSTPLLRGDARRLKQVVVNLLSNALRFTPPGGNVQVVCRQDSNGDILLSVTDTGIGMDAHGMVVALEPFGQVDTGLQRTRDGLGLGLPLSRRLVELHDGTLTIRSVPGLGTTVDVRFPAVRCCLDPRPTDS